MRLVRNFAQVLNQEIVTLVENEHVFTFLDEGFPQPLLAHDAQNGEIRVVLWRLHVRFIR